VTLSSLRRILEKDLNVEAGFLDTYKEFVTGLIKEVLILPNSNVVIHDFRLPLLFVIIICLNSDE